VTYSKSIAICVTGWHFKRDFYAKLSQAWPANIFVISHKSPSIVPNYLFNYIPPKQVFFEPNFGYDWGCYQQFITKDIWKSYDVIFFLHDDLIIHSLGFIPHTFDLLNGKAKVVGNGRNLPDLLWSKLWLDRYAHSRWLPPSLNFQHNTVRGSFLAMTSSTLNQIGNFEVFWDPNQLHLGFGNYSLVATCGKFQYLFGENCFAFLGSDYLTSPYITEEERGGEQGQSPRNPKRIFKTLRQVLFIWFYSRVGRIYVLRRMQQAQQPCRPSILTETIRQMLSWVNGVA
jgi:hypothetical protein